MSQPPRPLSEPLVGFPQLALGVAQGSVLLLACLAIHVLTFASHGEANARTLAFIALTAGNLALVRVNASRRGLATGLLGSLRSPFGLIAALASLTVASCIAVPALRELFGFAWPGAGPALTAIAAGVFAATALEWFRWHPFVRHTLGHASG